MDESLDNDIPNIITSEYEMTEPNQEISVFEGDFRLVWGDEPINLTGKIYFSWFPTIGIKYEGRMPNDRETPFPIMAGEGEYQLSTENFSFEKALITSTRSFSKTIIKGVFLGDADAVTGDRSISVTTVRFTIPNLRSFHGTVVRTENGTASNRITLEDDKHVIKLDKRSDFSHVFQDLDRKGGYINLYSGELTVKKGNISFDDSKEVTRCLSTFLTFLNGRRTSPLFLQGIYEQEATWTDFTYHDSIDQYKYVTTWPQKHSIEGLNALWKNFCDLWRDEGDRDVLIMAIHWYVEANSGSIITEGAIMIAQTCLELLYNWLIVEKRKLLVGRDSKNIEAAKKIRLLVSQLQVTTEVPDALSSFKAHTSGKIDGVGAFVQIRNSIIHSQEEKRKELTKINEQIMYEALQLAIWYIELSLLYTLNFQGKYYNRCSGEIAAGAGEGAVPYL